MYVQMNGQPPDIAMPNKDMILTQFYKKTEVKITIQLCKQQLLLGENTISTIQDALAFQAFEGQIQHSNQLIQNLLHVV